MTSVFIELLEEADLVKCTDAGKQTPVQCKLCVCGDNDSVLCGNVSILLPIVSHASIKYHFVRTWWVGIVYTPLSGTAQYWNCGEFL